MVVLFEGRNKVLRVLLANALHPKVIETRDNATGLKIYLKRPEVYDLNITGGNQALLRILLAREPA